MNLRLTFSILVSALFIAPITLSAADEEKRGQEQRSQQRRGGPGFGERISPERVMQSLSPEEREKIRAAFGSVWNDSEVVAAREKARVAGEELKVALRKALEKEDPEVQEILKRMLPRSEAGMPGMGAGPGGRGKPMNPEDRKVLEEARAKAHELENVIAVREKRESAEVLAEKIAASREYHETVYREMVKIDPRVEKILAKHRAGAGGERMRNGEGPRGYGKKGPKNKGAEKGEKAE
ncbi:MAG: hypothetical protein AAGA58_15830 [Verrucomicrobiota bacterium]